MDSKVSRLDVSKNMTAPAARSSSTKMELDEALKILNVSKDTPRDEMITVIFMIHLLAS